MSFVIAVSRRRTRSILRLSQSSSLDVTRPSPAVAAAGWQGAARILSTGVDDHGRQPMRMATPVPPGNATSNATNNASADEDEGKNKSDAKKQTKPAAYAELAKAKLSALVVATTAAGFVAAGGPMWEQASIAGCCVIGTALCSSSAAAWNQIFEVDRDARMKRTQQRPLVTNTLSMREASLAASAWAAAGTGLLWFGTDPVTTALGVGNIALYSGLYTYMKPRSIYNTWVGAVVGAIPPLMGWTAATGGSLFDVDAMVLGTTLYLWQMPHFFALSYMHRVDYKRGGFAMVPVMEPDGERTANIILRYAAYLSTVPFFTTYAGVTSSMFALEGIALNAYALHRAYKFKKERTNANARKVFLTSLWYLPSWLVLFLLHSKVWDEEKDSDLLRDAIVDLVHSARQKGREACIHEHVVQHQTNLQIEAANGTQDAANGTEAAPSCPVTLARKASIRAVADVTKNTVSTTMQKAAAQNEIQQSN